MDIFYHMKDPGEEYPITSWALYNIYMYVYTICLQNHKDKMFCPYGFGHVFLPVTVLARYGHVRLQTLYFTGQ